MLITRAELKAYSSELDRFAKAASDELKKTFAAAQALPVEECREVLISEMLRLESKYGAAAVERGAEFVEMTMPTGVSASIGKGVEAERIEKGVRSALHFLVNGQPDSAFERLDNLMTRVVKHNAREIPILTAKGYPGRAQFARVPQGPTTCSFCLMLASRGFVYHSAKTAGEFNRFHSNCDCAVVPGYENSTQVEGYHPGELLSAWNEARESAGLKSTHSLKSNHHELISEELRKLHPDWIEEGVASD